MNENYENYSNYWTEEDWEIAEEYDSMYDDSDTHKHYRKEER